MLVCLLSLFRSFFFCVWLFVCVLCFVVIEGAVSPFGFFVIKSWKGVPRVCIINIKSLVVPIVTLEIVIKDK